MDSLNINSNNDSTCSYCTASLEFLVFDKLIPIVCLPCHHSHSFHSTCLKICAITSSCHRCPTCEELYPPEIVGDQYYEDDFPQYDDDDDEYYRLNREYDFYRNNNDTYLDDRFQDAQYDANNPDDFMDQWYDEFPQQFDRNHHNINNINNINLYDDDYDNDTPDSRPS